MNLPEPDTLETTPDDALAAQLAALGHPARICILRHLARQDACCCREIVDCVDLAQSTVSQHLKVLVAAGLVRYEPENRKSRYSLQRGAVLRLSAGVGDLLATCCARR